jgi:ribosomal protein S18 acetylase RimI-like enzyme
MDIAIRRADTSLFQAALSADFSFLVDAYLEPDFRHPVDQWQRHPVEPHIKDYRTDGDEEEDLRDHALFVAMLGTAVIGRISVTRNWNGYGLLDHFGVGRDHRRGGIGRRLFEQAKAWAMAQGLPGLTLETQNNNLAACRFYERQGFELGGIDRFFYRGLEPATREVALFWYLTFSGPVHAAGRDASPEATA